MMIGSPMLPYSAAIAGVLILLALIGAIDVLGRDSVHIRGLPQWAWFLVVVALPGVGLLAWLIIGRRRRRRPRPTRSDRVIEAFPEYDRKGRFVPADPVADAAFLRQCRERAEQQRRTAEIERRRREFDAG
ncbi:PLD nuclease N-terminal domain-containing protein [Williamsia maris]|uniref:Phospholipase_D-nuclease N-terminal n=1 Tax=Williamsia maris TaxID=72806 RepID=A0ABT1HC29_9NOCA|nr:PLD nuclease N-terminal domain-containing protein [Williamsia maris]MCP2175814.1 Phospholipase_D-nuclease N-terminal [Williamsia maris]